MDAGLLRSQEFIPNVPQEIVIACQWWRDQLNHLCVQSTEGEKFFRNLIGLVYTKYKGHWYNEEPWRGQGYRAISYNSSEKKMEALLHAAADHAGLGNSDFLSSALSDVTMWIDPGEVAIRMRVGGTNRFSETVLYSKDR